MVTESIFDAPMTVKFWFEIDSKNGEVNMNDLRDYRKYNDDLCIEFVDDITGQKDAQYIIREKVDSIKTIRFRAKHG